MAQAEAAMKADKSCVTLWGRLVWRPTFIPNQAREVAYWHSADDPIARAFVHLSE